MATGTLTRNTSLPDSSAKSDFHNLIDTATISITNIVNADVDSSANIAASKLNLSTIAQTMSMSSKAFNFAEGASVASATTTNIWVTDGNIIHVTGTTTITGLSTAPQAGAIRIVIFDGALTLTHGANLILPGSANITTAAGDVAVFYADTTTQIRCIEYTKANGKAVVETTQTPIISSSEVTAATTTTTTSASYVDLNSMSITFTPTSASNKILILFTCETAHETGGVPNTFVLDISGAVSGAERKAHAPNNDGYTSVAIAHLTTLAASSQTVKVQWKTSSGTATTDDRKLVVVEFRV